MVSLEKEKGSTKRATACRPKLAIASRLPTTSPQKPNSRIVSHLGSIIGVARGTFEDAELNIIGLWLFMERRQMVQCHGMPSGSLAIRRVWRLGTPSIARVVESD